ncbi:hypothetical protein [Chitinimonas sp.]|uniref:hypothetical protein n=1 Tax=Chitinimonas sp. TaxID=1934313 RepID=UPI0035B31EE2
MKVCFVLYEPGRAPWLAFAYNSGISAPLKLLVTRYPSAQVFVLETADAGFLKAGATFVTNGDDYLKASQPDGGASIFEQRARLRKAALSAEIDDAYERGMQAGMAMMQQQIRQCLGVA